MKRALLWTTGILATLLGAYFGYTSAKDEISMSKEELEYEVEDLLTWMNQVTVSEWYYPDGYFDNTEGQDETDEDMVWVQDDFADQFKIIRLTEDGFGWRKDTYEPTGLNYITKKYYYNSYWGWIRQSRNSVETCYSLAYDRLRNGEYGEFESTIAWYSYDDIDDFPSGFYNDYFKIELAYNTRKGYDRETKNKYTEVEDAFVYYDHTKEYYKIVEKEDEVQGAMIQSTLKSGGVGLLIVIIINVLLFMIKTVPARINEILDIDWYDKVADTTLRFEKKAGNYIAIMIQKGDMKKGKVKFMDRGKKLRIKFKDGTLNVEPRVSLDNEQLELKDLDSMKVSVYTNPDPLL